MPGHSQLSTPRVFGSHLLRSHEETMGVPISTIPFDFPPAFLRNRGAAWRSEGAGGLNVLIPNCPFWPVTRPFRCRFIAQAFAFPSFSGAQLLFRLPPLCPSRLFPKNRKEASIRSPRVLLVLIRSHQQVGPTFTHFWSGWARKKRRL